MIEPKKNPLDLSNRGRSASESDSDLARAARRGDKRAFVEIVTRHQAMVCGIALGILNDFSASEDTGQEAFLTAWRKLSELRDPERLRPWLAQIARNAALTRLRRIRREEPLDENSDFEDEAPRPDDAASSREEAALIREALARIPEAYRSALILYYREGQSVRATAEALDISEDAVKQRLARGREMMRERMSEFLESALTRSGPGPIFTMTIAIAIGAMAAPAVVAASAFAASASGAATATSTPFITAMSTSKSLLITSALIAGFCVPVGYQIAAHREINSFTEQSQIVTEISPPDRRKEPISFEDSALFAEWKKLHDIYGTGPESMPAIHKAIANLKDASRRRAFHAALVAEWVQVDAGGGLRFYLANKIDTNQRRQYFDEWLAQDPRAAVDGLLQGGDTWEELARGALTDIAKAVPDRIPEVAAKLPASNSFWDNSVRDAFAIIARGDFQSARLAAEGMPEANRNQALAGIAKTWAGNDLDSTLAWIKQLPDGVDRNEITRAALMGRAAVDVGSALDLVSTVPAGGRDGYFASTTGARVLKEAAVADFDGTVAWLAAHPGKLNREDMLGLAEGVTERLNSDAAGFLTQHAGDGSLLTIAHAVDSALLNSAAGQRNAVWEWLNSQPETPATKEVRESVLRSAAWQEPALALQLASSLPQTPEGDKEVQAIAHNVLNGGSRLRDIDQLIAQAPERLREPLLKSAFESLPNQPDDPARWAARINQLPEADRAAATTSVARAWAERSPEEAIQWVQSLPESDTRDNSQSAIISNWASNDLEGVAQWLKESPPGINRDVSTLGFVYYLAHEHPEQALQWTTTIEDQQQRTRAAFFTVQILAGKDVATAQNWIEAGSFPPETKQQLQDVVTKIGLRHTPLPR